jgi:hypothetical protein
MAQSTQSHFGYYINLDERGDFYADVRDANGQTVFEIRSGASLDEGNIGVIGKSANVIDSSSFERHLTCSPKYR